MSGRGRGWSAAARTHTGHRRTINQDTFVCDPERGLLAVIDGMGGPAAGEVAAAMTRDALLLNDDIKAALVQANGAILRRTVEQPAEQGMGCVATAVRLEDGAIHLAHVGDTRAYLASRGGFEQLTRDHTVVAEERERLGMTEEQARRLPNQHQVTRDVGGQPLDAEGWVDTGSAAVSAGDVLLLCSDGLHDLVRDAELARMLRQAREPSASLEALTLALVDLALDRGGHDNVTIVVARREGAEPADEPTVTRSEPTEPEPTETEEAEITATEPSETLTTTLGTGRRGCMMLGVSVGLSVVLAGLGFSLGRLGAADALEAAPGWVAASAADATLIAAGPAGLDGVVGGDNAILTALGPLEAAGWARTEVTDGASVRLRAAELRFPPGARWQLAVGTGARLELTQAIIAAPGLQWELEVGPGASLVISDSTLSVGQLRVTGAADAEVILRDTTPTLSDEGATIVVEGPTLRESHR